MANPILRVESITKRFPGVVALDDVSIDLFAGEVLSVIGENGAGKSTLMKILAGIQTPDRGKILLDSKSVRIDSVQAATSLGISLIHQELNLCDNLSVAANIFLGRENSRWSFLKSDSIESEAKRYMKQVGLDVSPDTLARELSIGQQQLVEIAKALSVDARIVIMDEPTSSLTQQETEYLYQIIDRLKSNGISIIYISHRLAEVIHLSDRVSVLRDGKNAGELANDQITRENMVSKMVGRDLQQFYIQRDYDRRSSVLEIQNLVTSAHPNQTVSFSVREGEIVGLYGLVGSGRTEVLTTIFGMTPPLSGAVSLNGESLRMQNCRDSIAAGVALVPEDRKQQGVILEMSIRENISMGVLDRISTLKRLIQQQNESKLAETYRDKLKVKAPHIETSVNSLSGGNQQKVVVGKWLATEPKVLLLDEPTRGVDVGAKQEIYALMNQLADSGVAILFVSSELEEVLGISDQILVMHHGGISGTLQKSDFSEENVMRLATGTQVA